MRPIEQWPVTAMCLLALATSSAAQQGAAWPELLSFLTFPLADAPRPRALNDAPGRVDLSSTVPEPGDQGGTNTCTGWAVAYGACSGVSACLRNDTAFHRMQSPPADQLFSPAFIYALALQKSGCDSDVFLSRALKVAVDTGCCTMRVFPFDTLQVARDCRALPIGARADAALFRLNGSTALAPYSPDAMRQQLAAGNLVVFSAGIEDHFYDDGDAAGGTRPFTWHPVGYTCTSHAMLCMGYDDADRTFLVQNSWGMDWGYHGTFRMPYDVAKDYVTEAYAVPAAVRALELVPLTAPSDTALHTGHTLTTELDEGESVRHHELSLMAVDISSDADSLALRVHDDDTGQVIHRLTIEQDHPHTIYHEGLAYRITFTDEAHGGHAARVRITTRPQAKDRILRRALRNSDRFRE